MKKLLCIITMVIMSMTLAACGNDSSSDKVSVMIWDTYQRHGLEEIMKDFTAETGIETEIQVLTWAEYWTLLQAGAQGGSLPDVFWMHSNEFQRFADNGILLDLSDKVAASDRVDLSNFFDDIVELYSFDGRQYAIPKDIDTIALWYNRTMFEEEGIPTPDETWTWETLRETAQKFVKEDGSRNGLAVVVPDGQESWYNVIYSMGGYLLNDDKTLSGFDNPNTIKAMEYWESLVQTNVFPSLATLSENGPDILFSSGRVPMILRGSWLVSDFRQNEFFLENADVAVLPMSSDGRRVSIYNGLGWAANASGENTENAWKLIEFLSTEESQRRQAELGVTMSAFRGTSGTWINNAPQFNLQAYLDMMDDMVILPHSRSTPTWSRMLETSIEDIWLGTRPAAEVSLEMNENMNQILAEENR